MGERTRAVGAVVGEDPGDESHDAGPDDRPDTLPAGSFADWIVAMERAMAGEADADVPCGGCTACCTSSQFVHVGPDEATTLAHIPPELLFPAPRRPAGHVLLGYDEHGRCPMLVDGRCSIYEHRPRTCRTYDCRIFAAAGVAPDPDRPRVAERARRWRFDVVTAADRAGHDAVRAAVAFVRDHEVAPDGGPPPTDPTRLAVLAVEAHGAFLGPDPATGAPVVIADPEPAEVRVHLAARRFVHRRSA